MRICILEHEPDAPAGYFADWASERGHEVSVLPVPELGGWPAPGDCDLVVSLGSERSVHASRETWIADEIEFVRRADRDSVPVFGICFGAQLLAKALGGSVRRAEQTVVEVREIETSAPELIGRGPWLRWHEDVFALPPGATLLAGTDAEPLAFTRGPHAGVQFHPEAGREIALGWLKDARSRMSISSDAERRLLEELRDAEPGARERAFGLFDVLAARVSVAL